MSGIKSLGRWVLGDYQLYRIYSCSQTVDSNIVGDVDVRRIGNANQLLKSPHPEIRELHVYAGEDAYGYGCWRNDELLSVCWYWTGERYRRQRNFWELGPGEAKLVQISTAQVARGQGLAKLLLMKSAQDMAALGYKRLFARIWHSNRSSIRLFEKCRWQYTAFVSEIYPFGTRFRLRFVRRSGKKKVYEANDREAGLSL